MQNGKYKPIEKYLAPEWFTERVHIKDCRIQDVSLLTKIFDSCHYVEGTAASRRARFQAVFVA